MKTFVSSLAALLLCGMSNVVADAGAAVDSDAGARKLTYNMGEPDGPLPPKQMYKEIIYMEKMCKDYQYTPVDNNETILFEDPDDYAIGDFASFNCELYEAAVVFKQYGARKVGDAIWKCQVTAFESFLQFGITELTRSDDPIWDCTIIDYIGQPTVSMDYIRNEGLALFIYSPEDMGSSTFKRYYSHQGTFATIGGVGLGKGARGQLEVEWDKYKMTWIHIYTIEVWKLEQPSLLAGRPPYYPPH